MDFNLTLSPPQTEFQAVPGSTIIQAYEITNNSSESIALSSEVKSWVPQGMEGDIQFLPVNPDYYKFSLSNADLKLGETFRLGPGEHRQLILKITSAVDSPHTDNYFTFLISKVDLQNLSSDSSSQISAQIGSHILVSLGTSNTDTYQSKIQDLSIHPPIKDIFLTPLTFEASIHNSSPYFFKTFGNLKLIKNGKIQKEVSLTPLNVLTNRDRSLNPITIQPPFWPGVYQAQINLDASSSGSTTTQSFMVLPLSPLALIIVILIILSIFKSKR